MNDQLAQYSSFQRKSFKWWKKVAFRLINLCMVNAYVMYREWMKANSNEKILSQYEYRTEVVAQIIEYASVDVEQKRRKGCPLQNVPTRLLPSGTHRLQKVEAYASGKYPLLACAVCRPAARALAVKQGREPGRRPRRESRFKCTECDVSLCKVPCFELYHKYSDVENAWCKWRVDEDAQDSAGSSGAAAE